MIKDKHKRNNVSTIHHGIYMGSTGQNIQRILDCLRMYQKIKTYFKLASNKISLIRSMFAMNHL